MHLPLAFSIHHFINSVGADAGFAAIVGLAILVLLYFAQARETSSLRDDSMTASQRVAELEQRLAQLSAPRVTQAARPQPALKALVPAAPAGVAAPALFSATRLVPLPAAFTAQPSAAPDGGRAVPAAATAAAASPPPAPAAAPATGSNGTGEHLVPQPEPAPPPAPRLPAPPAAKPPPRRRIGGRAAPASRLGSSPLRQPTRRPPSVARRWLPGLVALLLAGGAIAGLLVVTSAGGSSSPSGHGRTTNAPGPATHAGGFKPSSVTVAVLNGTDVFQLAHKVSVKLHGDGYRNGTVATATDQTHTTTLIGYLPGHRVAASEIASALKLPSSTVQPADQSAQGVACPPPASCGVQVIVTVGRDLSNTP